MSNLNPLSANPQNGQTPSNDSSALTDFCPTFNARDFSNKSCVTCPNSAIFPLRNNFCVWGSGFSENYRPRSSVTAFNFERFDHVFTLNPLSANLTKWSNTLKQFVGNLPTNCLSVFGHFVGLGLKGFWTCITSWVKKTNCIVID